MLPVLPPIPDFHWEFGDLGDIEFPDLADLPERGLEAEDWEFEMPRVEIPQRIRDAAVNLMEGFNECLASSLFSSYCFPINHLLWSCVKITLTHTR